MAKSRRAVLAIALTAWVCIDVAQARQFHSSDVEAPDHPAVRAVAYMGELMRERSGGRLAIADVGALDRDSENFTVGQLRTGTLDMARISVSALVGSVPAIVIPTLPFLFTSVAHRRRNLDGSVGEELLASLGAYDLVGLCFYDAGARSIYTAGKPVRTPADMKGLKIRVQTSAVMAEVMQALGATPIAVPYAQVRQRFAAGTIDAAENNLVSYFASRHHEVAKVYSLTEHASPPAVVVFSRRVWDQLAAEDQRIIRQAARESVPRFRELVEEHEAGARSALAAEGVQFVTDIDKAAFVNVLARLHPKLVPDPRHRALLERVQSSQ
jgi:tripartite ATP-independent transporter DctP family solute receptor